MSGRTIGILLNLSCPLQCRHCFIPSGPERKEEFSPASLEALIDSIADLRRFSAVCFSGGEPFYRRELLRTAVAMAAAKRMRPAVVTSGYWASTYDAALKALGDLPALAELHLSTDSFHQEFIPLDYIRNAIKAAKKNQVWAITVAATTSSEAESKELQESLADLLSARYIFTQDTIPIGRGASELKRSELKWGAPEEDSPCEDLEMPAITSSGEVLACCGPVLGLPVNHPLIAGNIKSEKLGPIINRAERDPLLHLIMYRGPWGMAHILEDHGIAPPGDLFSSGCACDLCLAILGKKDYVSILRDLLKGELGQEVSGVMKWMR